jgi:hypothetical protein
MSWGRLGGYRGYWDEAARLDRADMKRLVTQLPHEPTPGRRSVELEPLEGSYLLLKGTRNSRLRHKERLTPPVWEAIQNCFPSLDLTRDQVGQLDGLSTLVTFSWVGDYSLWSSHSGMVYLLGEDMEEVFASPSTARQWASDQGLREEQIKVTKWG